MYGCCKFSHHLEDGRQTPTQGPHRGYKMFSSLRLKDWATQYEMNTGVEKQILLHASSRKSRKENKTQQRENESSIHLFPLNNQKSILLHDALHPAIYYCSISSPQKHQHFHLLQQHQPSDTPKRDCTTQSTVKDCSAFCQSVLTDESVHTVKGAQHE